MAATTRRDKTAAEKLANNHPHLKHRAVRAVREAMAVDAYAHPEGSSMFNVHSASGSVYTVDLRQSAREERACICADAQYNLNGREKCKHERRVRFMLGIDSVPVVLLDDRDPTLEANMKKFGSEPSVETQAVQVVREVQETDATVMADGGINTDETTASCLIDHPDCEGVDADRERPVLCFECWDEWVSEG